MTAYNDTKHELRRSTRRWCVTGVAGFIGSNLLETLLELGQDVIGLDNFSTGFAHNLELVRASVGEDAWRRFRFIEGDIRTPTDCSEACQGVDFVLHQAALGSVPRSIANPLATHESNVDGFLNMVIAARDAKVNRFVYASSSSVYGDHPGLPKVEDRVGRPLSPYAATKAMNEMYAEVFSRSYGMETVGLRYFNVFGPRQDPHGAYAAVIPRWIAALIQGDPVDIFGDGETSRDFCYVANAVQMNLLAASSGNPEAVNRIYNVAVGDRTTLNELFILQRSLLEKSFPHIASQLPVYKEFRSGDVRHSQADIGQAFRLLGFEPTHNIRAGMVETLTWYLAHMNRSFCESRIQK